ncbi:MAG: hypothetical protein R3F62_25915 [Planctomycetota bacterium]
MRGASWVGAIALIAWTGVPCGAQEVAPVTSTFDGVWRTTYGALTLTQAGDRVEGRYPLGGGDGTLEGRVVGQRLSFRYAEPTAAGEGWFELAPDGASFRGRWRPDGRDAWSDWTGTREGAEGAEAGPGGLFDTEFGPLRLLPPSRGRLRGVYRSDGVPGSVEGSLSGRTLRFTWREGEATGAGEFTFTADWSGFEGRWRSGEAPWKPWNGKRQVAAPGVVWLAVLETHWEERLEQQEYSWGAMLRAFFARHPHVQVRQRRVHDRVDLERALGEVALLPGRVAVVVACHGEGGRLWAGKDGVPAPEVARLLADAPDAFLLHFSSCEVFAPGVAERMRAAARPELAFSGYARAVDWAGSAVLELLYFDLVLGRGLSPERAEEVVRRELACAGDAPTRGSPLGALEFRVFPR